MLSKKLIQAASGSTGGGGVLGVEDVFSSWLYTGNGSTQTIENGINLPGEGGLVWIKGRSGVTGHRLTDTARGATKSLESSSTAAETTESTGVTSFSSTGFALGDDADYNTNAATYASWTFRKAAKFFDIVTYTGNGANRTVAHSLGSVPGCIMVKRTDTTGDWQVYHRSLANTEYLVLNSTAAKATSATRWNSTTPTDTEFSLGTDATVNALNGTYVAYLFAHDAGGFGEDGSQSIISCGSFTGGAGDVDLGWEAQFVLVKYTGGTDSWRIVDASRGLTTLNSQALSPNSTTAEASTGGYRYASTGFYHTAVAGPVIYIAIRRGPMKKPTNATKVFGLGARTGTGANATIAGGQFCDAVLIKNRGAAVADLLAARPSSTYYLVTSSTAAEVGATGLILQANPWDVMDGVKVGTTSTITNASSNTYIDYLFRRAPGFFDVALYTGTGVSRTVLHNLGVVPELMLIKQRSAIAGWVVHHKDIPITQFLELNTISSAITADRFNSTLPTSSVFTVSANGTVNGSGATYIAYLFATLPGISKVGSYTGTGTTLNINCGFTAGARFVMIKRSDANGNWYVWDTARGIVSNDDPYLLLDSAAAEVTNTDYIDPLSSGFQISSTAPAEINATGGSFIYLAIS